MIKRVVVFLVLIFIGSAILGLYKGINNSATTTGSVLNKELNPYSITLKVDQITNSAQEVKIIVNDKNLWNLIEKDRYYLVTYTWKGDRTPVLQYIEIDDNTDSFM